MMLGNMRVLRPDSAVTRRCGLGPALCVLKEMKSVETNPDRTACLSERLPLTYSVPLHEQQRVGGFVRSDGDHFWGGTLCSSRPIPILLGTMFEPSVTYGDGCDVYPRRQAVLYLHSADGVWFVSAGGQSTEQIVNPSVATGIPRCMGRRCAEREEV